ncbi:MAG: thiamine pyrophosphate-dependent dehydrogenase E1 component subunit alpha [Rhodospirillales bacterium]
MDERGNDDEAMFREALRIRLVEEKIIEIYPTDRIQSPVHLSIGQEAVAVGVCAAIRREDLLFGTYRSHAFYLAKGGDLKLMMAELYGKVTGGAKGKAGSMHLTAPEVGFMGSSAVVASTIPHAVGAALAAKRRKTGQVILAVFGDGATEEGVYHESVNFAALHRLPVLLVCENNGYAVHSALSARQAYRIGELTRTYGIPVDEVDAGHDPRAVRDATAAAVERIRAGGGPEFLEIRTCRFREHVGTGEDFLAGYRSETDVRAGAARDPLPVDAARVARLTPGILAEIEAAMAFAEDSPWPGREELLTDVL